MKIVLYVCLLCLAYSAAFAQEQKFDKKTEKKAEKERLMRPAEIVINAAPAKIKSLFLAEYARHEWQLDKETASSVTFTKRANLAASMAYGRSSKFEDIVTITEQEPGKTLVLVDSGVQVPQGGGVNQRFNLNADKKNRKLTEDLLQRMKEAAEKPSK